MSKIIYYGSYLIFPVIVFLFYYFFKSKKKWPLICLFFCLLPIWPRFIEPRLILKREHQVEVGFKTKIALISDLHLGIYKNKNFLERVVRKINLQETDLVIIAGDFLYQAQEKDLARLLAPLKEVKAPVFAVFGNHDSGFPGKDLRSELKKNLEENNVYCLENEFVKKDNFFILGLGDHWAKNDRVELLDQFKEEDHLIVIAHNPDTTSKYQNTKADLTFSGHTHGGQIRIPGYYQKAIPTIGNFDQGFYPLEKTKLFVSTGLGETGLPLRFLNPPRIELISLR